MKKSLKHIITMLLIACIIITGGSFCGIISVSAAAKPVISSRQAPVIKNACTVKKGSRVKLQAESGGKDVTKKCTWKSSRKSVASVSRKGVLTAKKAGTAYITAKYKGKTSKKLKVVVETVTDPETGNPADPGNTYNPGGSSGDYTITYDKNSSKGCKLNGPASQSGSGEILKFSTTVTPASGKKFLGWYDAPTGGNRIYETYKPSGDMTLYAHYTDENTQTVTYGLGCTYGSEKVSFMSAVGGGPGYDLIHNVDLVGPMVFDDTNNVRWRHTYEMSGKDKFVISDLPQPSIPGYTFLGWYTDEQAYDSVLDADGDYGIKVENGQEIDSSVTRLYARFSKKLTIHLDDLHGGSYPDMVLDTYTSIEDAGYKLPVLDIPGTTFLGWSLTSDLGSGPLEREVTSDRFFTNIMFVHGYMCSCDDGKNTYYFKHYRDLDAHWGTDCTAWGAYNDLLLFEEVDEITLYPMCKRHNIYLGFDPKGGTFSKTSSDNAGLTIYSEDSGDFKKGYAYMTGLVSDASYGGPKYFPGHEGQFGWTAGNMRTTMPFVTRNNYTFDGWIMPDGTKLTYDTILTENMTLSAKWIPGNCYVMFDPTDGTLTQEERDRVGLDGAWRYKVTTESSVSGSGKQLPVPVSSEGRQFEGWFTKDGEEVTKDTKITKDMTLYARWGTKTDNKPETQKPSADKDNSANKDTDSNDKNETIHVTGMTMTDMEWKPVDKDNNHYTIAYGGKGKQTGLGFTANVLPAALKDSARNVIWTSSNPDIISVTAGKEVIYSPNWFDYFEFGSDTGDVVLTATSEDNPDVKFDIHVTVAKK